MRAESYNGYASDGGFSGGYAAGGYAAGGGFADGGYAAGGGFANGGYAGGSAGAGYASGGTGAGFPGGGSASAGVGAGRNNTASEKGALSVSAAMALAKTSLEQLVVTLVGEVSELSNKPGYKAVYFTVKDDRASLPCMMWQNRFRASGAPLEVGALVEMTGRFTLYAAKGRMNFEVFSLTLAGEGRLRMQVANIARRLEAEGLMAPERKRPIPRYPESIGLVTSPRGAAVHDVLRTLRRRYPLAQIRFAGVPVEGHDAPANMIAALNAVAATDAEVILLVRGGGSFEDLMPFNDEALARAVAACPVPVVTGIGHEPDTSIADMVADLRASTPTGAAEAVSPRVENLQKGFHNAMMRLSRALGSRIDADAAALQALSSRPALSDPQTLFAQEFMGIDALSQRLHRAIPAGIQKDATRLDSYEERLQRAIPRMLDGKRVAVAHERELLTTAGARLMNAPVSQRDVLRERLSRAAKILVDPKRRELALGASRLDDLSPLSTLARGYAIARDGEGHVVKGIKEVAAGDRLKVSVLDGDIACTVDSCEER